MSAAIDTMMAEHRLIERVMDALEVFAEDARATPQRLAEFVDFFASYADTLHHAREEGVLFEMLIQHGLPRHAGPIAVMLSEHDSGRALMAELRTLSTRADWSDADRRQLSGLVAQFLPLLRNHIAKEDGVLYPMALSILPDAAIAALDDRCASFDAQSDQRGRLEQLAARLTA